MRANHTINPNDECRVTNEAGQAFEISNLKFEMAIPAVHPRIVTG